MHNRKPRGGFTLVELLTVIVIIGLLVAMVSVAVMNARITAQKAAITAEISQLDIAMTRLASEHGDAFPPDFSSFNSMGGQGEIAAYFSNDVTRYLNKRFPNYRPKNVDQAIRALYAVSPTGNPPTQWKKPTENMFYARTIDPAEALVFWLGGFSVPKGEGSSKLSGFSANPALPFEGPAQTKRSVPLYDFNQERLVDRDGDGWYEYVPAGNIGGGNGPPYVYFNSKSYANQLNTTNGSPIDPAKYAMVRYPKQEVAQTPEWGFATPYRSSEGIAMWVNPKKFQILSASLDGVYGNTQGTVGPKNFPTGDNYETADLDNLSNFSQTDFEKQKP